MKLIYDGKDDSNNEICDKYINRYDPTHLNGKIKIGTHGCVDFCVNSDGGGYEMFNGNIEFFFIVMI